jgi:protein-disulfide isomerase
VGDEQRVNHVRGPAAAHLVLEYGDYECPYSRAAYREIQSVEQEIDLRFAFRHFPLTEIHPHALAASAAAEAAALQGRFWDMHDLLFHRQKALEDDDLRGYARELGLDVARFDTDRRGELVLERIRADVESGIESGEVLGTPTLYIDGVVYAGSYAAPELLDVLSRPTADPEAGS